jgi:hypothetical protein
MEFSVATAFSELKNLCFWVKYNGWRRTRSKAVENQGRTSQTFSWRNTHRGAESAGHASFFLRSAHRFFIANDKRLRPSGVIPPRRRLPLGRPVAFAFAAPRDEEPISTSASIARTMRSFSASKSDSIFCKSTGFSFGQCN